VGILGAVARTTQQEPVLVPVLLGAVALGLWSFRRRRWLLLSGSFLAAMAASVLYTGELMVQAASIQGAGQGAGPPSFSAAFDPGTRSSPIRLNTAFPADFPLPPIFKLEHSYAATGRGAMTVRFRFRGEPAAAVRQLADSGHGSGWAVEVIAPHRLVFRKDHRMIEAWFGFPGHSLVLDLSDLR